MDNYYKFPWQYQKGHYAEGDKRISVLSANKGYVADVYRQTAHSNEKDWEAIATLITLAPELLAIAKAVSEGRAEEVQDLANEILEEIDSSVEGESKGFSFWNEIENLTPEEQGKLERSSVRNT